MRHELITEQEMADLRQIDVLLDEANAHSLAGDGHCKSSEGHISVSLGNHWQRDPDEERRPVEVEIYSYLLGPHRSHYFDSTAQALEVVQQWHRTEMAYDYATGEHSIPVEPDLYTAIERKRTEEFEESMRRFEAEMGSFEDDEMGVEIGPDDVRDGRPF